MTAQQPVIFLFCPKTSHLPLHTQFREFADTIEEI